jgi:Protein of unknown function (DUF1569)
MAYRWNLENVIETLSKLEANSAPLWGQMSAQRMVEHLTDTLRIATGKNPQPILIPEDKIERMQGFLETDKPMARGIEVPHAKAGTPLRFDEIDLAIDEFVEEWLVFEDMYAEKPELRTTHSFYGDLNFDQWRKLNDKHLNHHFEQFGLL